MRSSCRALATAGLFAAVVACSGSSNSSPGSGGALVVSATPSSVVADGNTTVAIHVSGAAKGPITVVTARGSFEGGGSVATFPSTPIDVVLHSCDAQQNSSCAGSAAVQAADTAGGYGATNVTFTRATAPDAGPGNTDGGTPNTDGGSGNTDGGSPASDVIDVKATASAARIPADGVAKAVITAVVTVNGDATAARALTFAQAGSGAVLSAPSATSDASGSASVTLTSAAAGGTAVVTVTDVASGTSSSVLVAMPVLGAVKALDPSFQLQGVKSSGFQEANQIAFQLADANGVAYPPGLAVHFTHAPLGGSFVGAVKTCSATTPVSCTATAVTDDAGRVTIPLASGQTAGLVAVTASATAGGVTQTATAQNIAVVGAKASGSHLTLECTPDNVPAFTDDDCSFSHYVGPGNVVTCTAHVADRFNNVLGVSTLATFASEAGSAGPPASTAQIDPKLTGAQPGLGVATGFISVTGGKLPADVTPFPGEKSVTYQDACGTRVHNPRDGLVTVIVMVHGEEGFVDQNGNGQWDPGEPFVDQGEPFIDENDDGVWNAGEPFVDVNGNGVYDGPNGVWDKDAVIWAETRILYTGLPQVLTAAGTEALSRFFAGGAPPAPTPTPSFSVVGQPGPTTTQTLGLVLMDGNLNELPSSATVALASTGAGLATAATTAPLSSAADDLRLSVTQRYCANKDGTGACSSVCATSPCFAVTSVGGCDLPNRASCTGFPYGSFTQAAITGACTTASSAGAIEATASVAGLPATITLSGTCSACPAGRTLCGSACVDTQSDAGNCGVCGLTCGAGQACQAGACQGGGAPVTPFTLTATASRTRIPADNGLSTSTITVTVLQSGSPAAGRTVTFAQTGTAANLSPASALTNASGQAVATLTAAPTGGTAHVTATDASGVSASVDVAMPLLGQVNLFAQEFQVQGVRTSGFQETNTLTFQLLDTAGQPYPDGLAVAFSHESLGGSYIGAIRTCAGAGPAICTASGTTDTSGQVKVLLTSGQTAGVVTVSASAAAGGLSASGTASRLAVVGAKANGAHITVDCSPKNVPALMDDDCSFSHYAGLQSLVTCTASFADRFNNALGIPTLATFMSEAGSAGPPATTPLYDAKKDPTQQTGLGLATGFIQVAGGKLPADVAPFAGEARLQYGDACGTLTHNPRDGLVTVIVMANGEEGFVDVNGNGQWDTGEPFVDLGEPYVDVNDNGQHDPGEPFVDVNGNGVYDGPNGKWDKDTVIWAETRIEYTGVPFALSSGGLEELSRFFLAGTPLPAGSAPATFSVPLGGTQLRNVVFMDGNLSQPTSATAYTIGTLNTGIVSPSYVDAPPTVDHLSLSFTQQYCDDPTAPASCSNVCASAPCYVVTNVGSCDLPARATCTGFRYGTTALVTMTGSKLGAETVKATATVEGVPSTVLMSGTVTP